MTLSWRNCAKSSHQRLENPAEACLESGCARRRRSIIEFIAERNVAASVRLADAFEACAERLPEHPYLYRPGRAPGTREAVVHPNYILIYEVHADTVEVMSVVHSRRQYPPE